MAIVAYRAVHKLSQRAIAAKWTASEFPEASDSPGRSICFERTNLSATTSSRPSEFSFGLAGVFTRQYSFGNHVDMLYGGAAVDSGTRPISDDVSPDWPGKAVNAETAMPGAAPADPLWQPVESGDALTAQEVRFAVAMSGGVSLAVWMGGVAREMNLLQEASNYRQRGNVPVSADRSGSGSANADADVCDAADGRPGGGQAVDFDARCRGLYWGLLRLLNATVTVDVLSGTSAGGFNAALLGLSSAAGVNLGGLRDFWLTTGSMDTLLRDPQVEKAPLSLMQGDKVLFGQLDHGIKEFYQSARKYTPDLQATKSPETASASAGLAEQEPKV